MTPRLGCQKPAYTSLMSLIPVTILTGFLGAGKTTLLKRVLTEAHGQKIAVIEHEFGEENIDNDILVSDDQEQIIQMSNGCICCTIREDLRATLSELAAKKRKGELDFERVIIETTGLADPGPVAVEAARRIARHLLVTRGLAVAAVTVAALVGARWMLVHPNGM